jgi:hypothetical protein
MIFVPDEAKTMIICLLKHDPLERLGAGGSIEIKEHQFFQTIDWDNLLRIKADFIPQLDGPDDTSYFDTRSERYNHELDTSMNSSNLNLTVGTLMDDTATSTTLECDNNDNLTRNKFSKAKKLADADVDDDTESELFLSFSSCSSKYKLNSQSFTQQQPQQKEIVSKCEELKPTEALVSPSEIISATISNTSDVLSTLTTSSSSIKTLTGSNDKTQDGSNKNSDDEILQSLAFITSTTESANTFKNPNNTFVTNNVPQQITNKNHNSKRFSRYSKSNDDKVFNVVNKQQQQQQQVSQQQQQLLNKQQQIQNFNLSYPQPLATNNYTKPMRSSKPHLSSASFNCKSKYFSRILMCKKN